MWELKAIEIGNKKLDAHVNISSNSIEAPYFKDFKNSDIIKIDKKNFLICSAVDVGDRNETILIYIKPEKDNEHKSTKSGKATRI